MISVGPSLCHHTGCWGITIDIKFLPFGKQTCHRNHPVSPSSRLNHSRKADYIRHHRKAIGLQVGEKTDRTNHNAAIRLRTQNPAIDLHRIRSIRGFCRFMWITCRKLFRPFSLMPSGQRNAIPRFSGHRQECPVG